MTGNYTRLTVSHFWLFVLLVFTQPLAATDLSKSKYFIESFQNVRRTHSLNFSKIFIIVREVVELDPNSGRLGMRRERSLDGTPFHHRAHTFTLPFTARGNLS